MKKKYAHTVLSDKVCSNIGCTKRIKLRLIEDRPKTEKCYKHCLHEKAQRGSFQRKLIGKYTLD